MQTKMRPKPKPRQLATVACSPARPDVRPITITGYDPTGKIVAEDKTDSHWKAGQLADGWRGSGLEVSVVEN